jgi:hypothetical protein
MTTNTPISKLGQGIIYDQIQDILDELGESVSIYIPTFSSTSRVFSLTLNSNSINISYRQFSDSAIMDIDDENGPDNQVWIKYLKDIIDKEISKKTFKNRFIISFIDKQKSISDLENELNLILSLKEDNEYVVFATESEIQNLQTNNPGQISYRTDSITSIGSYEARQINQINKELIRNKLKGTLTPLAPQTSRAITDNGYQEIGTHILRIGANKTSRKIGTQKPDFPIPDDICVFVIDSGVYRGHPDLNINETDSFNFTKELDWSDRNGHGTHVAGIIGAIDNNTGVVGIAPGVKIIAYKVLNSRGSGNTSNVVKALDKVIKYKENNPTKKCIVNLSLGNDFDSLQNNKVEECVKKGIIVVAAAGNETQPALYHSPGSATSAITVGAYDDFEDTFADFSNFGKIVDVLAPGVEILSTYIEQKYNGYRSLSGTSMAAPIVTGAIVNMIAKNIEDRKKDPNIKELTPNDVISRIRQEADKYSSIQTPDPNNPNPTIKKVPKNTYKNSIYIGGGGY